jgi:hypothetical protein
MKKLYKKILSIIFVKFTAYALHVFDIYVYRKPIT